MSGFRHIGALFILILAGISVLLPAQEWKQYPYTPEGSLISFPADEGRHPGESIEWWYIAGHLEGTESGTPYSFMLTYFYYPGDTFGISYDGFRILNISNDQTGEFHTETMLLRYADLATDHLHIDARLLNEVNEYWVHEEESDGSLIPFEYELSAIAGENALSLSVLSLKPPLIPRDSGLFDQGANKYTYYYSLTEEEVEGMLTFEGASEQVEGKAWIDRQYGTYNPDKDEKYEWFYLQLSNGMDLNIWNLFSPDNRQPGLDNYRYISVYVDTSTQYTTHNFKVERLSWSRMPESDNCYAQQWRLTSEREQMDITFSTLHQNSEVNIPFSFYEGALTASGNVNGVPVSGIGFAELVKSYENPLVKICSPTVDWNKDSAIRWKVENPDDGRPLLYDLTYSITGEDPWNSIAEGIGDTLFFWNTPPLVKGDSCWFRVEGFTADKILQGSDKSAEAILYTDGLTAIDQSRSVHPGSSSIRIYPNPAGNILWLEFSREEYQSYSILDMKGRMLLEGSLIGEGIRIGALERGVYLLLLEGKEKAAVQRFIKWE